MTETELKETIARIASPDDAARAAAQNRADGPQRCRRCRSCALLFGRQGAGCAALRRWSFPFRLLFGGRRRGWRGFAPFPRQPAAAAIQPLVFITGNGHSQLTGM